MPVRNSFPFLPIHCVQEKYLLSLRKIVKIDEAKCNGCGLCIPKCAEGALKIVDGKAKLISEQYCDGLGACLGQCPQKAITVEERYCEDFNQDAVKKQQKESVGSSAPLQGALDSGREAPKIASALSNWPIQLMLVPPKAPYLEKANLLIVADCVPFAYGDFHRDFLQGKPVIIGCSKLDDLDVYQNKLKRIFQESTIQSVTVVTMEVPCCFGLLRLVREAVAFSGKQIPLKQVIISIKGKRLT